MGYLGIDASVTYPLTGELYYLFISNMALSGFDRSLLESTFYTHSVACPSNSHSVSGNRSSCQCDAPFGQKGYAQTLSCELCPTGTWYDPTSLKCTSCIANTYSSNPGQEFFHSFKK